MFLEEHYLHQMENLELNQGDTASFEDPQGAACDSQTPVKEQDNRQDPQGAACD